MSRTGEGDCPIVKAAEGANTVVGSPANGRPQDSPPYRAHTLQQGHRRELEEASAIDPAVIDERGYRTIHWRHRDDVIAQGIPAWAVSSDRSFPGLLLPMYGATGDPIGAQWKPAVPIPSTKTKKKPLKYVSAQGQTNRLDVHPRNTSRIRDVQVPLWITEGLKKGDSLASRGCCVVTLTGVFNWRSKLGTLGDWEDVPLKGREIIICFDADASTNMLVARAMVRLGRWCRSKGAKRVRFLIVPKEVQGQRTKGVDDFFAAGGTLETLDAMATTTAPDTEIADDTFTDARLAEVIADEVLRDRFCWSKGLGWMAWTGTRWTSATDEAVGEAVRRVALRRFQEAVEAGRKTSSKGWYSTLSANRERAIVGLTKGIVEVSSADAFDAHPDLLNTPEGIVDLRTGRVQPHDPDLLLTKITRGNYRPGYTHPDWTQALTAPADEDTRAWMQTRIGQALTGHPTPDGVIVVCQGTGENGKTGLLHDGVMPAAGDYGALVSPKLITTSKNEHSTERADLRGQRFLMAEELTEDRALNVTAIKQITDVSTIKARYCKKDNFTFTASHSLFITTNYIPVVHETDHGTWRRFALVQFPYTFRKPSEALVGPMDRRGDPQLKARLRAGPTGQHDAVLTWAVDGARRWYAEGFPALPASVEASTRDWRKQADRILGFWDECLVADTDTCIATVDLIQAFNSWLRSNGHHEWAKETFHPRFKTHAETARHHVTESRTRKLSGVSRPPLSLPDLPTQPLVYHNVRFRRVDEIRENTQENADVAEVAHPSGLPTQESFLEGYPKGSARSATFADQSPPERPDTAFWRTRETGEV